MQHNRLLLTTVILCSVFTNLWANGNIPQVKAPLKHATVFFAGAELLHTTKLAVERGVNEVCITEISPQIDLNSIKINASNGIIITSYEYSLDYINKKKTLPQETILKDSVKLYERKIDEYNINTTTNNDLLELLKANKSIAGSQTGLSVAELMKMVDYYSVKSNELNKAQASLKEKKQNALASLTRIKDQLAQEMAKNVQAIGVLKINCNSPRATSSDFAISYFTKNASWTPYYTINAQGLEQQIEIAAKARVAQVTGLDWTNVKLTLSTAAPTSNKIAPLFNSWLLDFRSAYSASNYDSDAFMLMAQNDYSPTNNELHEVVITRSQSKRKTSTPMYLINGEISTKEEVDQLPQHMIANVAMLEGKDATALYGSSGANGVVLVTTVAMSDFVTHNDSELNMEYVIDLPYTIAGNGKAQSIDLKTEKVTAQFKHFAAPKLADETFILAEIPDWQKLGLLSGKANLTFDGTYIGETMIDATSTMKNLALTMGTDNRVAVKREKMQDYSSKSFLGKDVKQEFTYKITVRNNQNRKVNLLLKEQYPQSSQKEIEVELDKSTTPASYVNKEIGVYNWEMELEPGETKIFTMKYSVKYPKDKMINL